MKKQIRENEKNRENDNQSDSPFYLNIQHSTKIIYNFNENKVHKIPKHVQNTKIHNNLKSMIF